MARSLARHPWHRESTEGQLTTHPVLVHCTRLSSSAAELCGLLVVGLRTLDSDEVDRADRDRFAVTKNSKKRVLSVKGGG